MSTREEQQRPTPFVNVERHETIDGHIYTTRGGQVVIDSHATCEEHLLAQATHKEQPLYRCRRYLRELIPEEWMGKRGTVVVDRSVATNGEVVGVTISFLQVD